MAIHHTMEPRPLEQGKARDPESLTTDEVRQGVTGFGVRYVLFISTAAALVALAAAWVLIGQ
ncbi:MAG: hypothetical protein ACYCZX_19220 [Rhodospirillaceae bacterium]